MPNNWQWRSTPLWYGEMVARQLINPQFWEVWASISFSFTLNFVFASTKYKVFKMGMPLFRLFTFQYYTPTFSFTFLLTPMQMSIFWEKAKKNLFECKTCFKTKTLSGFKRLGKIILTKNGGIYSKEIKKKAHIFMQEESQYTTSYFSSFVLVPPICLHYKAEQCPRYIHRIGTTVVGAFLSQKKNCWFLRAPEKMEIQNKNAWKNGIKMNANENWMPTFWTAVPGKFKNMATKFVAFEKISMDLSMLQCHFGVSHNFIIDGKHEKAFFSTENTWIKKSYFTMFALHVKISHRILSESLALLSHSCRQNENLPPPK